MNIAPAETESQHSQNNDQSNEAEQINIARDLWAVIGTKAHKSRTELYNVPKQQIYLNWKLSKISNLLSK